MIATTTNNHTFSIADLEKVEMKTPESVLRRIEMGYSTGTLWRPIPHHELAETIRAEIESRKWKVIDARFTLSPDESDMVGTFDIDVPKIPLGNDVCLSLGVLTSNAMRRPLKIVIGATTFVCLNGMVTGEILLNRRHTIGLDLKEEFHVAMDEYLTGARNVPRILARLKRKKLKSAQVNHLLLESARQKLMPWKQLGAVDDCYHNPPHQEFGTGTAWSLLQAFTLELKETAPLKQFQRSQQFLELLEGI